MKMNKIIRYILLILVIAGASVPSSAKRSTLQLSAHPQTGMNALDYKLQKALPIDTFPANQRGLGKNIFVGGGVGGLFLNNNFRIPSPGMNINAQVGSWFDPVNGMRLLIKGGSPYLKSGQKHYLYGGVQLDYMMNLTNLLRGYNPSRRFELIGTAGLEANFLRKKKAWNHLVGVGSSLQFRFYSGRSLYFFVEPHLAVLVGSNPYGNLYVKSYRMKLETSLSLGIGYRFVSGKGNAAGITRFMQQDDDNLYFGANGGGWIDLAKPSDFRIFAGGYIGKMFSASSGLQLTAAWGEKGGLGTYYNRNFTIGTLDYVLNFTNVHGGYRPDRKFNVQGNIGAGAAILFYENRQWTSPAFGLGITAMYKLSPNWAITLHPQAYVMNHKFFRTLDARHPVLASVDLGLRYTIGDFTRLYPNAYDKLYTDKRWFITAGAGYSHRMEHRNGPGADFFMGFGRRFTPVSSYRIMMNGSLFPNHPGVMDLSLAADYMSSITTAMHGYDPERLFDLQFVLGVLGGVADYEQKSELSVGARVGLQGNFRLSSNVDLFIEPQLQIARQPSRLGSTAIPELRLNVGVAYRLGTYSDMRDKMAQTFESDGRNFAGIAGGISYCTPSVSRNDMAPGAAVELNVGRWFSRVSGLRLVLSNDWAQFNRTVPLGAAHVDYLLNISSLIDRRPERKFHIIGALGAGVDYCLKDGQSVGAAAYGGLQFRFNLPANFDLHIEPGAQLWQSKALPADVPYKRDIIVGGRLMGGISYRF